jgi:hypothetical protein
MTAIRSALLILACMASALSAQEMRQVGRGELDVTEGAVGEGRDGMLAVDVAKMRAVVKGASGDVVELRVRDRGVVADAQALESGEMRRQIALKMRAQDPCNLLYVSWRIEPKSAVVVQLKLDPRQHTSAECGNGGYVTIKPRHSAPPPALSDRQPHQMDARLDGTELTVAIDGRPVWDGAVGDAVRQLQGPVGVRSDNGKFDFALFVAAR